MDGHPSCCPPVTDRDLAPATLRDASCALSFETALIPGGKAMVGTAKQILPMDGEGPLRKVRVAPFRIGVTAITVAEFATFVEATGYLTEAERIGWSFVFHHHVPLAVGPTEGVQEAPWWRVVHGATWQAPNGPDTHAAPDHPVTQVSWNDASAFAKWAGGRLPTEAEWEHAARGGQGDVRYPWGDADPNDTDHFPCNIWQGDFPRYNAAADGWDGTAPAQSYAPNAFGLYNMVGNTWEWTSDAFRIKSLKASAKAHAKAMAGRKTTKGGSFLCHASYCTRYRIAARTGNTPDSATTHQGFRLVWDA